MARKVIVTGGSRGIGAAIARRFASAGDSVVIIYKNSDAAAAALAAEYPLITPFRADVCNRELLSEVISLHSDTDILVNNAGISLFGLFDTVTRSDADALYNTNLIAPVELSRLVLPNMLSRKRGVIINIASVWGEFGASCEVDYSAAKAGLIGFTKALAKEVGPSGIRVLCVCPGVIDTEMNGHLSQSEICDIIDAIPLERLGTPGDVAEAVFFLASDSASYITGAVLDVNGGF